MRLGLGLGLGRSGFIKRGGIVSELKNSGINFGLMASLADGKNRGINDPFTTPFVDVINGNNIALQNFDATITDGWDMITAPSGNLMPYLNWDGVNSVGVGASTTAVDILGLDEFLFFANVKQPAVLKTGWIFGKRLDGAASTQIAMYITNTGSVLVLLGGTPYTIVPSGNIQPNGNYKIYVRRELGRLICELNDVELFNAINTKNILTSEPFFRIGARTSNSSGTSYGDYYQGYISHLFIGKNPNFRAAELSITNSMIGYMSTSILSDGVWYDTDSWDDSSILKD